jgi:hypothetical protein
VNHIPAQTFFMAIKHELATIPMGTTVRNRLYSYGNYRDVDVASISGHAPDGTERWNLSITGGMRPRIELTMWHAIETPALAFTIHELAAIDRANNRLAGSIARALRANGDRLGGAMIATLEDRAERIQRPLVMVEVAS